MPTFTKLDAATGEAAFSGNGSVTAERPRSVFADAKTRLFTRYAVELTLRDRLMGGIPKDLGIMEGWLRTKAGLSERSEELKQFLLRSAREAGHDVREDMSWEEIEELSKKAGEEKHTNGFKRDAGGLYLESRAVKALIKENVNILYPYQAEGGKGKWGPTRKAARALAAERVFVDPDHIPLGRQEADGTELFIGHTTGPSGPKSNLTYYEFVEGVSVRFVMQVAEDMVPADAWPYVWSLAEENGLGALRSQGFGRFDVTRWERLG